MPTPLRYGQALRAAALATLAPFLLGATAPPAHAAVPTTTLTTPTTVFVGPQSQAQQRCINALNKAGGKIAKAQGKEHAQCFKNAAKGDEVDPAACLTADAKGKISKERQKLEASQTKNCADAPDFGKTDADNVTDTAVRQTVALATDIFGEDLASLLTGADKDTAGCQGGVLKAYQKITDSKLKIFTKCKKDGLKAESIDSAATLEGCFDAIEADSKRKIAKAVEKLDDTVTGKCGDITLSLAFPGVCDGAGEFTECVDRRAECRTCLMLNEMDGLAEDCDLFDDGIENFSCLNDTPRASAGCGSGTFAPGTHPLTFMYGGLLRTYDIHVPATYDDDIAAPVLLNLHPLVLGGPLHGIWTIISAQNPKSEEAGFIVLQPDGTGDPTSWNGGEACCDPAHSDGIDDVGFLDALVAHAQSQLCIDERRVYSTGMSNGGYLSHRVACEHPERVAAIVPVVGSFSAELTCAEGRGVPVLQLSGANDSLASRQASVDRWLAINECGSSTNVTVSGTGELTCTTHDDCKDGVEVTHCVVTDGGHCTFTDADPPIVPGCTVPVDFAAQDLIWDFLKRWRLP